MVIEIHLVVYSIYSSKWGLFMCQLWKGCMECDSDLAHINLVNFCFRKKMVRLEGDIELCTSQIGYIWCFKTYKVTGKYITCSLWSVLKDLELKLLTFAFKNFFLYVYARKNKNFKRNSTLIVVGFFGLLPLLFISNLVYAFTLLYYRCMQID